MEYEEEINFQREQRNKFAFTDASPLTEEQKKASVPLVYYPVDIKYRLELEIVKFESPTKQFFDKTLATPKDEVLRYGLVEFEINRNKCKLTIFKSTDEDAYFTLFRDTTSDKETYGGGRYLSIEFKSNDSVILDFNLAFNFACAYNENYSCPIPPRENVLDVPILAGEKKYLWK